MIINTLPGVVTNTCVCVCVCVYVFGVVTNTSVCVCVRVRVCVCVYVFGVVTDTCENKRGKQERKRNHKTKRTQKIYIKNNITYQACPLCESKAG